jgi:hypothetical protein
LSKNKLTLNLTLKVEMQETLYTLIVSTYLYTNLLTKRKSDKESRSAYVMKKVALVIYVKLRNAKQYHGIENFGNSSSVVIITYVHTKRLVVMARK